MRTFLDDKDRRRFLENIGDLVERDALEVHAFCLMPNHVHLLVCTPHAGLSRWMRHVNGDHELYRGYVGPTEATVLTPEVGEGRRQ